MSKKNLISVLALVAVLVIVSATGFVVGRHRSASTTTSTTSTSTSTTIDVSRVQPASAIWPFAATSTRFGDPRLAAETFARDYLGFTNPVFGVFQRGDSRSGEIVVHAADSSTVTTLLLRQLSPSNSWWVLGAVSSQLAITAPVAMAPITSPVVLRGRSTAFEAVVNVEIRQDGSLLPLARSIVRGGSMGMMGPFVGQVRFTAPTAKGGAIVLRTYSAKDGHVIAASALRVSFAR